MLPLLALPGTGFRLCDNTGLPHRATVRRLVPADVLIAIFFFAGNLVLLGPWCMMEFSGQPWNNGFIYVGIARMFRDHSWTWNGLQYAGAPFRYLYPPIFHALVGLVPFVSLGRAFHAVAGAGYALVPVSLYVLARQLFPARLPAVFAAIAYSFFPSPAYVLPLWRAIAHPFAYAPWGFVAFAAYDEAPHAFGFAFALLAIAAAWRERWTLAAILAGAVFLINWPALIGLGFPVAGIAAARMKAASPGRSLVPVAGMIGAAYGLSAFWMTPGYFVSSTLLNRIALRHTLFADPWNGASWTILAAAAAVVAFSFLRRVPQSLAFILVWAALSGLVMVSYTLERNYLLPSPNRYMLEFNAALVLLIAGLLSTLRGRWLASVAVILIAAGSAYSFRFLTHAWKIEPHADDPRAGAAYQVAAWLKDHANRRRVFVSGELDFTLNVWADVAQVGGTQQDITNFLIYAAEKQVAFGCGVDAGGIAELWLRALNAPLLVVHEASSREFYHWYSQPDRFAALPVEWNNGAGDVVRRLPDFDAHEAVVVSLAGLARIPPMRSTADEQFLRAYVNWATGSRPVAVNWKSDSQADFNVNLSPGEAVLLKINSDRGWRAAGAGIQADPIGFQLVRVPPGQRHVELQFGASWDTWLGRALTLVTLVLMIFGVRGIWIAAVAVLPAIAVWGLLMAQVPATTRVAEDTFIRIQPPLINPLGIVDGRTAQQPPLKRGSAVSIFGLNLGGPHATVRVRVGGRSIVPDYQGPNQINFRLPDDAPSVVPVSAEVNDCAGNEFMVATQ